MKQFSLAVVLLALASSAAGARPPDNADPGLGPWFQGLRQPDTGISCCSVADCRQTEYRASGGHYEALIQDRWVSVPPQKVLSQTENPTGRAVVCWTPSTGIMCFV